MLFSIGIKVFCTDRDNAVDIDGESDLDARNTTRCRTDAFEFEPTKELVIVCPRTFTLEDLNFDTRLIIFGSRESLLTSRRNGGVTRNKRSPDAT